MELKNLTSLVLLFVFVGMLLGVGVLVIDSFSRATRDLSTATDGRVNISTGTNTLSKTYCVAVTGIKNAVNASTYSIDTYNVSFAVLDSCVLVNDLPLKNKYNISYTYLADTDAQAAMDATNDAISPIATTWMPLIVTVAVLAIILTLVIGSFAGGRM